MSYTYLAILDAARDYSPWFDRTRVSSGPAIRMASDVQRDLYSKATRRNPWSVAARTTLNAPFTLNTAITTLPAFTVVLRAEVTYNADTEFPDEIPIVSSERQTLYQQGTACYLEGRAVWLTGTDSDWNDVASLVVWYVPAVPDMATESDLVTLPDDAKQAFVLALAARFALRVNGFPIDDERPDRGAISIDVGSFQALAQQAETTWLREIGLQRMRARAQIRGQEITQPKLIQGLG